jgi:hypothetical protein
VFRFGCVTLYPDPGGNTTVTGLGIYTDGVIGTLALEDRRTVRVRTSADNASVTAHRFDAGSRLVEAIAISVGRAAPLDRANITGANSRLGTFSSEFQRTR